MTLLGLEAAELARGSRVAGTFFFLGAWVSVLLLLLGLEELLLERPALEDPGRLGRLALSSIPWWLFFEAFNVRLKDWVYVGVPPTRWIRWGGYALAFATVLPAIIEAARLLEAWLPRSGGRPRPWLGGRAARSAMTALGAAFLWLAAAHPRVGYALVWGSVFLLVEPWLMEAAPERSWLAAFAAGDAAPLRALLASGVVCGLLWEALNYWAAAKWVYTVPWPRGPKLFEMPWAGYLGFPAFALECGSAWGLHEAARERLPSWAGAAIAAALAGFCFWAFGQIDGETVRSLAAWP